MANGASFIIFAVCVFLGHVRGQVSGTDPEAFQNSVSNVSQDTAEQYASKTGRVQSINLSLSSSALVRNIGQTEVPFQVNGIFPNLVAAARSGPRRSESGIGALMPWADKLYMVSYLTSYGQGSGTGLFAIDENFMRITIAEHNSTYANRIIHRQSNQVIIGAWLIDMTGNVRVFPELLNVRIAATAEHLTNPETMVYMLGIDGPLWECNIDSLTCTELFDLASVLGIPASIQPIFKSAHTMNGRLVVASSTFTVNDFLGTENNGRLAEWTGTGQNWTILAETAFVEVTGRRNFGQVIYALGWDRRSVILKTYDENGGWQNYRLPKGSHAFDQGLQAEWTRIREVETERYLMDMHGLFYELSPLGWSSSTWGLRPICQHLRVIPDFTSYKGFLVLGGNQVSPMADNNVITGQPQSGLWFGKTDDLWQFGKPKGWGAVWREDDVWVGNVSEPFLMTGFDKKVLHVISHEDSKQLSVHVEIDVTGSAGHLSHEDWVRLTTVDPVPYVYYVFPDGFSAHWARLRINGCHYWYNSTVVPCKTTAYFHYT